MIATFADVTFLARRKDQARCEVCGTQGGGHSHRTRKPRIEVDALDSAVYVMSSIARY